MRTSRVGSVRGMGPVQTHAAVYVRVSTEEQAREGVSLAAQEARAAAYAGVCGLEIKKIMREEGVSGAKPLFQRPRGAELEQLPRSGIRHVITLKLDRLFRSAEDALRVTRGWDEAGIALHIIDMGGQTVNTASAMGRMMLTMMAAFAELERNLIAERTAMALAHLKSTGQVYGAIPYGSQPVDSGRVHADGKVIFNLEVDAGEAATLGRIAELRSAGKSLRAIAEALNVEGVECKRGGKRWYASTVRSVLNQVQESGARAAA